MHETELDQRKRQIVNTLVNELSEDKEFLTKVNKITFGLLSGKEDDMKQHEKT